MSPRPTSRSMAVRPQRASRSTSAAAARPRSRRSSSHLLRLTGSDLEPEYRPAPNAAMFRRVGSNERMVELLGWEPELDLDAGLTSVIELRQGSQRVKVLVTGASGFVAPHLIEALVARGDTVVATARDAARIPEGPGIEPLRARPRRAARRCRAARGRCVVHLAQANVPYPAQALELYRVNTLSTLGLLDACRAHGRPPLRARLVGHGLRPRRRAVPRVRPRAVTTSSTRRRRSTPRTSSRATPTSSTAPSRCASSPPTAPARSTA